jgi:hypothetical protein
MTRLRGHFDGRSIVLDEPVPVDLRADTPVEILVASDRDQALREFEAYSRDFWSKSLPDGIQPSNRS